MPNHVSCLIFTYFSSLVTLAVTVIAQSLYLLVLWSVSCLFSFPLLFSLSMEKKKLMHVNSLSEKWISKLLKVIKHPQTEEHFFLILFKHMIHKKKMWISGKKSEETSSNLETVHLPSWGDWTFTLVTLRSWDSKIQSTQSNFAARKNYLQQYPLL